MLALADNARRIMTDSRMIVEQAQSQGFLGFLGTPRAFGTTDLNADDVKRIAGEVAHDAGVKTLLVRNMNISHKAMQFLADIIVVTPSITNVLLYQNQISPEGAKTFSDALGQNSTITKLNVGKNFFPLSSIVQGIAMCPSLTELDFSFLEMGEGTALDDFTAALKENTTIAKMTLFSNKFTERHGKKIGEMIKTLCALQTINLSVNELGDDGLDDICQALKTDSHLKNLVVGANGLTSLCGKSIAELLMENKTLISLNLIDNRIGVDGVMLIADALKVNSTLQHLNLNKNCLGCDGVFALASGIRQNDGVRSLSIYHNRIGPTRGGAKSLYDMISTNTTLTSLNIVNPLGEEIICSVCNGTCVSRTLTSLCLQRVHFDTDKANNALCRMLEDNHSLTYLSLSYCRIDESIWPTFFRCLSRNTCLMDLSLRCVLNRPERIALLRDYLCQNPPLQSINLGDNNIRVGECMMLADVLRCNTRLTVMNLDSNYVEVEGGKTLISALEQNYTIVELFKQNCYIGNVLYSRMEELINRNKARVKPAIESFICGIHTDEEEESPASLLHDAPELAQFISQLALPEWHPHNIIDQKFSD